MQNNLDESDGLLQAVADDESDVNSRGDQSHAAKISKNLNIQPIFKVERPADPGKMSENQQAKSEHV